MPEIPVTISERITIADAAAEFDRLRLLDDVWTEHLDGPESVGQDMVEELVGLGHQLDACVTRSAELSTLLCPIFERHTTRIERFHEKLMKAKELDRPAREWWLKAGETKGGIPAVAVRVSQRFAERSGDECSEIAAKLARLQHGEPTTGDLSPRAMCYAGIAGTIALGIVCTVATGATGGLAIPVCIWAGVSAAAAGSECGRNHIFPFLEG